MARVFSGIQPTGELHLGNLLGALQNWVQFQDRHQCVYCVVDLHALTIPKEPGEVGANTVALTQLLVATGVDPDRCTLFVQSHLHQHNELGWLLECNVSYGELSRMVQFKDKSEQRDFVSAGLFTYPALQAADIIGYDTDLVPVGEDQRQHIEITRDIAERFNSRYGQTFVVPEAFIPPTGARVMDLQHPENKMSKSADSPQGTIGMLDDLKTVEKKIKRAVTDNDAEVRYDPSAKPGVSNLLSILGAATGADPAALADRYEQYGPLKTDTAAAVCDLLSPIQARYHELAADPAATTDILRLGAAKARVVIDPVLDRARTNIGLTPA
ncbi:MAG: tryptophan--tRNA ligase [Acidimicrobiia bacterium]|nr:tryptophan--tRNA ligase [Acidimicrobiia bacterium]MDH5236839.1 tryptophan--tRNA ligase [Acidimicrobiia bacterium]